MKTNNEHEKYFYAEVMEANPMNNDLYLDLPWHLNEMLNNIDDEKDKEMIVKNINTYYDTLNTLLINHTIEHPLG